MRDDKEERKKQASANKQTRQSNTAHPRQSLFLEKMSCLRWDSNPRPLYSRQSALPTELPRQLSWLGPNLTSHSTPDEQANHQLSMKEKAGMYMYMYIKSSTCTVHYFDERHFTLSLSTCSILTISCLRVSGDMPRACSTSGACSISCRNMCS